MQKGANIMPVNMQGLPPRGTSPSKGVDNAADRSFGSQKGTENPQEALNNAWNKRPVEPSTEK